MAERVSRRIPVNIEAEVISCRVSYPAFIRNVSEYGIHVKIANIEPVKTSKSGSSIDLRFQLPSGNTINLNCKKKWAYKNASNSFIENIGVEIINPPNEYRKFIELFLRMN